MTVGQRDQIDMSSVEPTMVLFWMNGQDRGEYIMLQQQRQQRAVGRESLYRYPAGLFDHRMEMACIVHHARLVIDVAGDSTQMIKCVNNLNIRDQEV